MKTSEIVQAVMFDYEGMTREEIVSLCAEVPRKVVRWMGAHHPDMRTRRIFFEITNVEIGEGSVINPNFVVSDGYAPLLKIGKRVAISPNVTIICESGPNNSLLAELDYVREKLICALPVVIEDDVWIGANVIILPGRRIHTGAVVGAGSVVTADVPRDTIVGGNPARPVRARFSEEVIAALLEIRWWDWDAAHITKHLEAIVGADLDALRDAARTTAR